MVTVTILQGIGAGFVPQTLDVRPTCVHAPAGWHAALQWYSSVIQNHRLHAMNKFGLNSYKCLQTSIVDDVILVSTEEAEAHAREAARNHGLLVRFAWIRTAECTSTTLYHTSASQARCFQSWQRFPGM